MQKTGSKEDTFFVDFLSQSIWNVDFRAIQFDCYPICFLSNIQNIQFLAPKENSYYLLLILIHVYYTNEKGKFIDYYIAQIISRWSIIKGHARNQRKGRRKRNSLYVPPRHVFLTIFLSLYSQRVKKSLQRTLPNVFCIKFHSNHRVRVGLKSRHNHVYVKKFILFR